MHFTKCLAALINFPDGVFTIQPPGKQPVKTYCDLTSRGGGWTLLLTSKTHTGWTADNVKSRNADQPSLDSDYSILDVADGIKDHDTSPVGLVQLRSLQMISCQLVKI